jgi:hypothetical protein
VVEEAGEVGRGRKMEKKLSGCRSGETVAAKRVVRWSCLSRRNVWLLPLPRGENDNQERRSSIAHMSKKCVYTTGKRCAVGHADDSEGVTMRSGRRVNDDTLGNLNPTTACFDVSLGGLSARRARKGRTILHALPFGLSLDVRLSQFEGRRASFLGRVLVLP